MTATETAQDTTVMGVHLLYPDAEYTVGQVGHHFAILSETWNACQGLIVYKRLGDAEFGSAQPLGDLGLTTLRIVKLRIASPMELVAAVAGSGAPELGLTAYALHLFAKVLRNPEAVGAWVPRVVAAWEIGWRKAAKARRARHTLEREAARAAHLQPVTAVVNLDNQLANSGMRPTVVFITGAGDPPEDLEAVPNDGDGDLPDVRGATFLS